MSTVDVVRLLQEVDSERPCGPNLEYDPEFVALELAVLGKPEVQYGTTITPATPPDWKAVKRIATGLLERSRDLRVAVPLLRANLASHGVSGLADSLGLIERLLDERWDSVHPELDVDDDMDSTLRVNSLAGLADSVMVLKDLKDVAFISLPVLGQLSLRLLEVANGEMAPAAGEEKLALPSIEAAIGDVDPAVLETVAGAFARAHASAMHIEVILVRNVGSAQTINLDGLTRSLKRGRDFLLGHMTSSASSVDIEIDQSGQFDGISAASPSGIAIPINREISNRADVLRVLESILKYYQQSEPSSPVPILLERAQRLVPMSFWESMEDLAPDGLSQLKIIQGNSG